MRPNGPNKRPRNRNGGGGGGNGGNNNNHNNNRRPHMPSRSQTFDSHGPDIRIRGSAFQVYEKYLTLARDATLSGDRIQAENYFQHAEHYYRIVNAQEYGPEGQRRPRQDYNQDNQGQDNQDNQGQDGQGQDGQNQDSQGSDGQGQGRDNYNSNNQRDNNQAESTYTGQGNNAPLPGEGPQPEVTRPARPQPTQQVNDPNSENYDDAEERLY